MCVYFKKYIGTCDVCYFKFNPFRSKILCTIVQIITIIFYHTQLSLLYYAYIPTTAGYNNTATGAERGIKI